MRFLPTLALPAMAACMLAACGGLEERSAPDAYEQLIELRPGMQWVYDVAGVMTPPGGAAGVPIEGQITISIEAAQFRGESVLALKFKDEFKPVGAPPPGVDGASPAEVLFGQQQASAGYFYYRQHPETGALYLIGDNAGPNRTERAALNGGGLIIPGRWNMQAGYRERVLWEDGGYTENYLSVAGVETIDTGIGPLRAWRAPNGSNGTDNVVVTGTDWWALEIGHPAKFEAQMQMPNGARMDIVAVLAATNVE